MVGTGFDLGAAASSPVRTESQAGLGGLASLHVTVKVLRPHVSGRRRTNTNSAFYPFRGGMTHVACASGGFSFDAWIYRPAGRLMCVVIAPVEGS